MDIAGGRLPARPIVQFKYPMMTLRAHEIANRVETFVRGIVIPYDISQR